MTPALTALVGLRIGVKKATQPTVEPHVCVH